MKKLSKKLLSLVLTVGIMASIAVSASAENSNFDTQINNVEKEYLQDQGVNDRQDLTSFQQNELSRKIQEEKNRILGEPDERDLFSYDPRYPLNNYTGGIFLQFDSSTGSGSLNWYHGHAAIGYGQGTIEILHKNEIVREYGNFRVEQWKNSNSGGFYTVRGAYSTNNSAAASNAYSKLGSSYYVVGNGDFSGYTCSGLVATSWTEAGFDLGGKWTTPRGLENSSKTVLQWLWADV